MLALSRIFYRNVKRGHIKVEEITIPRIKKEVEELLAAEKGEKVEKKD